MNNYKNPNNEVRLEIFNKWFLENLNLDVLGENSMQLLHNHYVKYCEAGGSIPFKRKYFAYLLRKNVMKNLKDGSVLIYYNTETTVKGINLI